MKTSNKPYGLVALGAMPFTMTSKIAAAAEGSPIFKPKPAHLVWANHIQVKVYQVAVVGAVALTAADTVGIVAYTARGIFANNMGIMVSKGIIVQNRIAVMTIITQLIVGG